MQRLKSVQKLEDRINLVLHDYPILSKNLLALLTEVDQEIDRDFRPSWKSVSWEVLDFEGRAMEKGIDNYDTSKFEYALETMIRKHDATLGITWDTIDHYLDSMCRKD